MENNFTDEEGEAAVKLARDVIESVVKKTGRHPPELPPSFGEKCGAFVTLNTYPDENLRGCIGFPEPYFPLKESLARGAEGATHDPRFFPLREEELKRVTVEVSIMTPPAEIVVKKPREYLKEVIVGKHGLIVARGRAKGLLLPQVPVEWKWNVKTFLSQTCVKAGLPPDAWLDKKTQIYSFTAEIFSEKTPGGEIERREI